MITFTAPAWATDFEQDDIEGVTRYVQDATDRDLSDHASYSWRVDTYDVGVTTYVFPEPVLFTIHYNRYRQEIRVRVHHARGQAWISYSVQEYKQGFVDLVVKMLPLTWHQHALVHGIYESEAA